MDGPGINPNIKIPGYFARRASSGDLPAINQLAKEHDFNVGLHNLRLYFETSPNTWHVIVHEQSQQIVAYDSWNQLPHGCFMGYQILVSDGHKGKGLTKLLNSMSYATFPIMGNATDDSVKRYKFQVFQQKFLGALAFVQDPAKVGAQGVTPEHCTIRKLEFGDFDKLMEYDYSIINIDRREFMKHLLFDVKYSKSLVAIEHQTNAVKGYGCIRFFGGDDGDRIRYWSPSPVYAATPELGRALLHHLIGCLEPFSRVWIHYVATNRVCWSLVNELKAQILDTEQRQTDYECLQRIGRYLDWAQVYTDQEFWPV